MRRGEVYDHVDPHTSRRSRVVILTADHHIRSAPMAAELVRGGDDIPPYSIALAEVDPISGYLMTVTLREVGAAGFGEDPVCTLTGATMSRVNVALRTLLDL